MLVLHLSHSAKINGYERLIVLIHSLYPSSNQMRTLFWYELGGLGRTVAISARSHDVPWDTDRTYLHSLFGS